MKCPKCNSDDIEDTFTIKDGIPVEDGYYCHNCGEWWRNEEVE